ncbi:MAG TPA: hypothetical protein VLY04_13965 [Bryobacteraceae bacterium]|nr:hypothetical protein [Bryobacteraceae bacterium]
MATMQPEPRAAQIDRDSAWSLFDAAARRYLRMSGEEFLKAWDANSFSDPDPDAHRGVMDVAILIPLVR